MQTQYTGFAERLSAVIGLIYETSSDESLWPQLLEGLAALVLESKGGALVLPASAYLSGVKDLQALPLSMEPSDAEQYLLACLAPHFTRSQEMQCALQETEIERDLLERYGPLAIGHGHRRRAGHGHQHEPGNACLAANRCRIGLAGWPPCISTAPAIAPCDSSGPNASARPCLHSFASCRYSGTGFAGRCRA